MKEIEKYEREYSVIAILKIRTMINLIYSNNDKGREMKKHGK